LLLVKISNPTGSKELYSIFEEHSIIDSEATEFYRDTWGMRAEEEINGRIGREVLCG